MNAKDNEMVEKFIELRAQDWTLIKIANELKVHRNTVLEWSRRYESEVKNLRTLLSEVLSHQQKLSRNSCISALGHDLGRLREELEKRDLKDIPTHKLFNLVAQLRKEANEHNGPLHLSKPVPEDAGPEEYPDPTFNWEA